MSIYNTIFIPSVPSNVILENLLCDITVSIGDVVRVDSSGLIMKADASSLATANALGVVESKANASICTVRVSGFTPEIYTGLDVTKEYFLSDIVPGAITTTVPTASGHVVLKIGQPYNSSELIVLKNSPIVRL